MKKNKQQADKQIGMYRKPKYGLDSIRFLKNQTIQKFDMANKFRTESEFFLENQTEVKKSMLYIPSIYRCNNHHPASNFFFSYVCHEP